MRARHAQAVSRHLVRRDGRGDAARAGANGSGKTSLLRILCGLAHAERGRGALERRSRSGALKEEYARELVYIGHAPAVKDDLTPRENLAMACALAGRPAARGAARRARRASACRPTAGAPALAGPAPARGARAPARQRPRRCGCSTSRSPALDADGGPLNAAHRRATRRRAAAVVYTHRAVGIARARRVTRALACCRRSRMHRPPRPAARDAPAQRRRHRAALLRHRGEPVSARHRRRAQPAARHRAGRDLGRGAALLDALARRLFAADHADGTLEQMLLGAAPLGVIVAAKAPRTGWCPACRWSPSRRCSRCNTTSRRRSTACLPYHCCWARRCSA